MNMAQSINHWAEEIKPYWRIASIVLLAFIFFGLWQISVQKGYKQPLEITTTAHPGGTSAISVNGPQNVVASKTGTKYYLPWCGALSRIKPENRVEFATPALARAAGYSPAGNCKGVK